MGEFFSKLKSILFHIFAFLGICACLICGLAYFGFSKIKTLFGTDICFDMSSRGDSAIRVRLREWSDYWENARVRIKLENGGLKVAGGRNVINNAGGRQIIVDGCEINLNEDGVVTFCEMSDKFRAKIAIDAGAAKVENSKKVAFENIAIKCSEFINNGHWDADEFRLCKCASAKPVEDADKLLNISVMHCKNFYGNHFDLINEGSLSVESKLTAENIVNRGTISFEDRVTVNVDCLKNFNTISAKAGLWINADVVENRGRFQCDGYEQINADRLENFDIIVVNRYFNINVDNLMNQGKISCAGNLECNADNLENIDAIAVGEDFKINASTVRNQGKISCGSDLKCNADNLENANEIAIGGDFKINASTAKNQGKISCRGKQKFNIDHIENTGHLEEGAKINMESKTEKNTKEISVVPYDAHWPEQYETEKSAIVAALGDDCLCIHHIGSTSVPGLAAKPKIDIIAAAKDRERAIAALEKIGYKYRGEWGIPLQGGFAKRKADGNSIDVNLHMFFDADHPEIELNVCFRDYLRKNPAVRDEYALIKQNILSDSSSYTVAKNSADGIFPEYTLRKAPFINDVLRKTGYNRLRALTANTEEHWEAVKKFREIAQNKESETKIEDRKNSEYFVLYRGVDVIGCAEVLKPSEKTTQNQAKIVMFEVEDKGTDAQVFFKNLIEEWCSVHELELIK